MSMNYFLKKKSCCFSSRQQILFLSGTLLLLILTLFACKKKPIAALTHPPKLSLFAWGKGNASVQASLARLEKAGWKIKFRNEKRIWLIIPSELDAATNTPAFKKAFAGREAPALAELQLYLQNSKLILARLYRHDRVELVEAYHANLRADYGLKQTIWAAKPQISQDLTGNNFITNIDLYETSELFFTVHRSLLKEKVKSLEKGRNYHLEVAIYSKQANQGLNAAELIKRLQ